MSPDLVSGWMAEMHSDGHVIAGLWSFPEKDAKLFLSEWHDRAFADFALLAKSLYAAAHQEGTLQITCTLLKASRLSFVGRDDRSQRNPRLLARPDLQWGFAHAPTAKAWKRPLLSWAVSCNRRMGFGRSDGMVASVQQSL
jgi:hypothetical protein